MLWSKITIIKERVDAGAVARIQASFDRSNQRAGEPADSALLVSRFSDPLGRIEIYFTPRASEVAAELLDSNAGIPCNPPGREQVEVLAGSSDALSMLNRAA